MLCEFSHSFPRIVAQILERDRGLTRNFREESVTDLLMASLVGLEPFGIRVDFPDEPSTGGDMEWVFVAPQEIKGGRYLRLIIQAKRSKFSKLKSGGYWYYGELARGSPAGSQAQTLVNKAPNGTLPLYMFYHSLSNCVPAHGGLPAIEGVNLVFARDVAAVVKGGCSKKEKAVDFWRGRFMPLADILCWPAIVAPRPRRSEPRDTLFLAGFKRRVMPDLTGGFHPEIVANRLRRRLDSFSYVGGIPSEVEISIEPAREIPAEIQRAIRGEMTPADRIRLERPRAIFSTRLHSNMRTYLRAYRLSEN